MAHHHVVSFGEYILAPEGLVLGPALEGAVPEPRRRSAAWVSSTYSPGSADPDAQTCSAAYHVRVVAHQPAWLDSMLRPHASPPGLKSLNCDFQWTHQHIHLLRREISEAGIRDCWNRRASVERLQLCIGTWHNFDGDAGGRIQQARAVHGGRRGGAGGRGAAGGGAALAAARAPAPRCLD